jgi:hypothetical protein
VPLDEKKLRRKDSKTGYNINNIIPSRDGNRNKYQTACEFLVFGIICTPFEPCFHVSSLWSCSVRNKILFENTSLIIVYDTDYILSIILNKNSEYSLIYTVAEIMQHFA